MRNSENEMTFPMRIPPEVVVPYGEFETKLIRQLKIQKNKSLFIKIQKRLKGLLRFIFNIKN